MNEQNPLVAILDSSGVAEIRQRTLRAAEMDSHPLGTADVAIPKLIGVKYNVIWAGNQLYPGMNYRMVDSDGRIETMLRDPSRKIYALLLYVLDVAQANPMNRDTPIIVHDVSDIASKGFEDFRTEAERRGATYIAGPRTVPQIIDAIRTAIAGQR